MFIRFTTTIILLVLLRKLIIYYIIPIVSFLSFLKNHTCNLIHNEYYLLNYDI